MARDIPSLNAIRFFESAARHLSFTKAGNELFVTQSAVSRQIKLLEEQLNCQLFVRSGPKLQLTAHGEAFQHTVGDALRIIRQGVANLRRDSREALTVSLLPSFATIWLIPRIPLLEELEPSVTIRLESSFEPIDFSQRTDVDVAIRLGRGCWAGLYSEQLTRDHLVPVCTPEVARDIKTIEDLNNAMLLIEYMPYDEWASWFEVAGLPYEPKQSRQYDDTGSQIRAALSGQGVSLCREEFVREYFDSGELVRLFDIDFVSSNHYYFVCPKERLQVPKIKRLRDALLEVSDMKDGK